MMMNFAHPAALRRVRAGYSRAPPASPPRLLGNVLPGARNAARRIGYNQQYPAKARMNAGPSVRNHGTINQKPA